MSRDNKSLGMFRLDGIPPAPRGLPQIEVSFDIDANGIVNVSAKDKATNKEQKITITGTSNLNKDDIDKMVRDAESHAEEDKNKKEEVEVRNNASSLVHAAERLVKDLEGKMSDTDKTKLNEQREELDKALKENEPVERIKSLSEQIQETMFAISSAAYQQAGAAPEQAEGADAGESKSSSDEDVIDAEYSQS